MTCCKQSDVNEILRPHKERMLGDFYIHKAYRMQEKSKSDILDKFDHMHGRIIAIKRKLGCKCVSVSESIKKTGSSGEL